MILLPLSQRKRFSARCCAAFRGCLFVTRQKGTKKRVGSAGLRFCAFPAQKPLRGVKFIPGVPPGKTHSRIPAFGQLRNSTSRASRRFKRVHLRCYLFQFGGLRRTSGLEHCAVRGGTNVASTGMCRSDLAFSRISPRFSLSSKSPGSAPSWREGINSMFNFGD